MPNSRFHIPLRPLLAAVLALCTLTSRPARAEETVDLRIGYQKYGTLIVLKSRGTLEKKLAPLHVNVRWTEFPAGPPLLEALNVGSIDFGQTGEAPPIFAQAAGADLVYVANELPEPTGEAIVVPKGSAISSVKELKGKKIAVNKGSNVHYFLVKALEKAGLAYSDVQITFLPPADARAAFERGAVDAWSIWDPFLSAAQEQIGARALVNGAGLVANRPFLLAGRGYAQKHPAVLNALLDELEATEAWAKVNPSQVADVLTPALGLERKTVELALTRYVFGLERVPEAVLADQQKIADTFYDLKLIPKRIEVRKAVVAPATQAAR